MLSSFDGLRSLSSFSRRRGVAWPAWADARASLDADFVNNRAAWRTGPGASVTVGTIAEMFTALGDQGGATVSASGLSVEGSDDPRITDLTAIGAVGSAHTLLLEFSDAAPTLNRGLFALYDSSVSNDYLQGQIRDTTNAVRVSGVQDGGSFLTKDFPGTVTAGTHRAAVSADASESFVAFDGASDVTTGPFSPSSPDTLRIGRNAFTVVLGGPVRRAVYLPQKISASNLASMTS